MSKKYLQYNERKIRKYKINRMYVNARNILTIENKTTKECKVYHNTLYKIL